MKNLKNFVLIAVLFITTTMLSQTNISGTVVDETGQALPGASVVEKGTSNGTSTDFDGKFSLSVKSTKGTVVISFVGYTDYLKSYTKGGNLGVIQLAPDANVLDEIIIVGSGVIDLAEDRKTPVAVSTIKAAEIQQRGVGNVEVTEIVKNTPSVYVSQQTGFGDSQLFMRGFDNSNVAVLLNGQPINSVEDGRVFWSNWSGIADVANGIQVQRGLGSSKLAISSVGGTMNLVMKSAERKQGGFVRLLAGNDGYVKGTASYNTGLSDKGWSFSFLVDHWQADNKWADGTFGSGQTYFLAAGYKPNEEHSFGLLITGAPQQHGQRWSQSIDRIAEDPKFNQHWGYTGSLDSSTGEYTGGDIESERTNYYHKPVMNFNWDWNISEKSSLSTVAYASVGRGGGTGPRGDGRVRTDDGQLNYFAIEEQNSLDPDGIGQSGDYLILDNGAEEGNYIRRASINNHFWYGLVSNYETELSENFNFNAGVDVRFYKGDHFRQVVDFYGLDGWANDRGNEGGIVTESFSINPWSALFDFADEDQRIAYSYSENINYQGVFSQIEYSKDAFSTFFQGALSHQSFIREGDFAGQGKGKSDLINKLGFNLKGGLAYDIIDDKLKIFGNAGYYSRQPFFDTIFGGDRVRTTNDFFDVDNEKVTSIELGMRYDDRKFFVGFDAYYTIWNNRFLSDSGTLNGVDTNIFLSGVQQNHIGVELDMRYKVLDNLTLKGFLSSGNWTLQNVDKAETFNEDTGDLLTTTSGPNVSDVHITDAPQFSMGFGVDYEPIDGLQLNANWNLYERHFITDTDDFGLQTSDIGTLPSYFLVDTSVSYDFKLGDNNLVLTGNVYNLFDEIALNGSDSFGFFNTNGLTWNASVKYKF